MKFCVKVPFEGGTFWGGARGDHLALGRADSRGHVRCSSFLTNKIIMVDYSKWDKLDYGDDDDSDGGR